MRRYWLLAFFFCSSLRADYGWMPAYNNLFFRTGFDFYSTRENFLSDGTKSDVIYSGQRVQLRDIRFWFEGEYTFAQDVAARLKFDFVNNTVSPTSSALAGTGDYLSRFGLGDILLGVKYSLLKGKPGLAGELTMKVPTYSNTNLNGTEILPGDGTFDVGFWLHATLGHKKFFAALSPGLVARFGGFASQFQVRTALGARIDPIYFMLTSDSVVSLSNSLGFDSSLNNHNAFGTGGSYARLSGSPSGLDFGLRMGVKASPRWFLEFYGKMPVAGARYANYLQAGITLMGIIDFFTPDTRPKIKEVPFDEVQEATPAPAEAPKN